MSAIQKFIKSSSVFFIGSALSKVIVFFMMPIYTKYLPTDDYGYFDVSSTYLSLVLAAIFFEIWSTTLRFMYQNKEKEYKRKMIANGMALFFIFLIIYTVLFAVLGISSLIPYLNYIYIWGISIVLSNLFMFITRGMEQDLDFAVSGIINTFITALLSIIFIIGLHMNFSSLYIAAIIGDFLQVIFLEYKTHILYNFKVRYIDTLVLRQMLRYTLPLCMNTTAYWILSGYSRILISKTMSLSDNGIYAVGHKFSYVIVFATNCFTYAWQGVSFERDINDSGNGDFYSKACRLYIEFLSIAIVLALPVFNVVFPYLVDKSYMGAAALMPLFLINACLYAYTTFAENIFATLKKTNIVFLTMGISCVLHILISYPLIKLWGLNGVNTSILICYLTNIFIGYYALKKLMNFKISSKLIIALFSWVGLSFLIFVKMNALYNMIWFLVCLVITAYIYRRYINLIYEKALVKIKGLG